jgi:hypothetical protein
VDALFDGAIALQFASSVEYDTLAAAKHVTAAVAILPKSKADLVSLIGTAGLQQAAEAHEALRGALAGAGMLLAIL